MKKFMKNLLYLKKSESQTIFGCSIIKKKKLIEDRNRKSYRSVNKLKKDVIFANYIYFILQLSSPPANIIEIQIKVSSAGVRWLEISIKNVVYSFAKFRAL